MYRLGILSTHPIQYYSPWYRALAATPALDVTVYYAHRSSGADQAAAGFGVAFEWDLPLLEGYRSEFLENHARRPSVAGFWGCHTPELAAIIARERFDAFVVHGWYNRSYWQAIRACWRTRTPVLIRGDSTLNMARGPLRRAAKWLTHRWFVPRFDGYLVVGQRAREYYLAYGADPARMEFTPHFVDNDRFARAAAELLPRRAELRRHWQLPERGLVFVYAAKFIPKKRPLDFVRALARACAQCPEVSGLMVGDGPLRGQIEAALQGATAPIRLAGFLNQTAMPGAYAAADALVLPSDGTETWGLVVNEAMACGLPALVSDQVGCAPDLVHDNVTGFVFPFGDVAALAERMVRLGEDAALAARLGTQARRRVQGYSVAAAVEGMLRLLERLPSRPRPALGKEHAANGCTADTTRHHTSRKD
jgi:glycosyltransferase involved in cell wall biosynthesis